MAPEPGAPHQPSLYWRKNRRIIARLLAVWGLVTLGVGLAGPQLDVSFFGWPFNYWMASQGALLVYVALIWVYALYMDGLDQAEASRQHD